MNKNIDLTKILEGCEGMEFYYSPLGINIKLESLKTNLNSFPIKFNSHKLDYPILLTREGCIGNNKEFPDAECVLFPSKDQRDWSKFERPILIDTPMMCSNIDLRFFLGYYKTKRSSYHTIGYMEVPGIFRGLGVSIKPDCTDVIYPYYVIPFDKFNPNDIEESLKYNIQK